MNSQITFKKRYDYLLIEIKPKLKFIIKFVILIFFVIPLIISMSNIIYLLLFEKSALINGFYFFLIIIFAVIIGSFILIRSYLKRIFEKEIIIVSKELLILSKKFLFTTKKREFRKAEIMDLRYIGHEEFTKHPLDTKGFDYIGLGIGEREVQFFIEKGNLAFYYNGTIFRFGKNVYEEDAQEIIKKINTPSSPEAVK